MLLTGVALAETKVGNEDVAVIGAASASPATLVRGGTSTAVGISITANDGNIPNNVNQCDNVKNTAKTKEVYSLGSGLTLSGNDVTVVFECRNYSSSTSLTRTLNIQLSAGLTAPLGRSEPTVTFGNMTSAAMVKLGDQLMLRTADGDGETAFVNPKLFINVNPRAVATVPTVTPVSSSQINVAWDASPDHLDITSYVVQRASVVGGVVGSYSNVGTVLQSAPRTFADTGLTASTVYSYQIIARYTDSVPRDFDSVASAAAQATTLATASTTVSYERPLDESKVGEFQANRIKRNRVVPVKVTIDEDGAPYTGAHSPAPQIQVRQVACQVDADGDPNAVTETAGSANTGTAFRWDSSEEKWVFNLGTGNLTVGNCYRLDVSIDGSRVSNANWAVIQVQR